MQISAYGELNPPDALHGLNFLIFQVPFAMRGFQTSQAVLARHKVPKIRVPSKKTLAAKAKRRAAKARKNIYVSEKMPLLDAIAVLRVSPLYVVL